MIDLVALRPIGDSVGMIKPGQLFREDPVRAMVRVTAGDACLPADYRWPGLNWQGAEVAILAGGQSLTQAAADEVRRWRAAAPAGARRTIVINDSYKLATWADLLYASDTPWWQLYFVKVQQAGFTGELWTTERRAAEMFEGLKHIESRPSAGLGRFPGVIHQGGNGGYMAINLAYQAGARRLILLGYDMHGHHWHGRHPSPLPNPTAALLGLWVSKFDRLAADLADEGVEVVNCSRGSRLECFKKQDLMETLR